MKRSPYPLQWPEGFSRTASHKRQRSKFGNRRLAIKPSPYESAKDVLAELGRLGASHIVITTQLPTRHDGLPYSDGRSDDPGVAVWFVHKGQERVFACDAWHTPGENLRAIALSIEAMRGLSRWGMADVTERTFAGYAALPPAGETSTGNGVPQPPPKREWYEVFDVIDLWKGRILENADLLAIVKRRHRERIKDDHPDQGGDPVLAAELNAALTEAETALTEAQDG